MKKLSLLLCSFFFVTLIGCVSIPEEANVLVGKWESEEIDFMGIASGTWYIEFFKNGKFNTYAKVSFDDSYYELLESSGVSKEQGIKLIEQMTGLKIDEENLNGVGTFEYDSEGGAITLNYTKIFSKTERKLVDDEQTGFIKYDPSSDEILQESEELNVHYNRMN